MIELDVRAGSEPPSEPGTDRVLDPDATAAVDRVRSDRPPTPLPDRLGRYVVVEQVGAGGMGRVLRAYDPKLSREVALKQLARGACDSEGAARIVREAQAMAQLSHPNLVAVYDVEENEAATFIAMEYVEGGTLRTWLLGEERSWRVVVDVFVAAGRGLVAAHAAGIVHRDFKPSNVMVGSDGRVRVMDFGVARGLATSGPVSFGGEHDPELSLELTDAGTVIGTPPYMAPEQHRGEEVGPASDQYAFCVALYEALFGVRPFGGADARALLQAKLLGRPAVPTGAGQSVPRWLHAAVVRGLAVEPADRWPSMDALLGALERGQARVRARRIALAVAAFGLALAAIGIVHRLDRRGRTTACEVAGASIAEVWPGADDATRTAMREAMLATGASYAATTVDKVQPWLDAWASAWQDARTQACLRHHVEQTWDADVEARALECLDERRSDLVALVDELGRADAKVVQKAVSAVAALPRLQRCTDPTALAQRPALPVEQRNQVADIRAELSRAGALQRAGLRTEAATAAEVALAHAEGLGWIPLVAQARATLGRALERTGAYERAERELVDAYVEAGKASATEVAAGAATELVYVVGYRRARYDDGRLWARLAEVELAQLGIAEDDLGAASRLNNLAAVNFAAGANADATALYQRALAIREKALGPDHPDVATTLNNLANIHGAAGAYAEASALHERALAIREQALGPDHPDVAQSLTNLANVRQATGAIDEATALFERALTIGQRALGPEHPDVAASLDNLAVAYQATGAYEEAKALHERALEIREKALGPDHPDVAASLNNLGNLYVATGEYEKAEALQERTLAIIERALGPEHVSVANPLLGLGEVAMGEDRSGDAVALFERALAIREAHPTPAHDLALTRFRLAQALWESQRDEARAVELAERAEAGFVETGRAGEESLADVEQWLASRHPR